MWPSAYEAAWEEPQERGQCPADSKGCLKTQNKSTQVIIDINRLKSIDSTVDSNFTSPSGPRTVGHRPWTIDDERILASSKWDRIFFCEIRLVLRVDVTRCDTMWHDVTPYWSSIALLADGQTQRQNLFSAFSAIIAPYPLLIEATWSYDSIVLEY